MLGMFLRSLGDFADCKKKDIPTQQACDPSLATPPASVLHEETPNNSSNCSFGIKVESDFNKATLNKASCR